MSWLVDTNLLVYATAPRTPQHRAARRWLTDAYEDGTRLVGLCWPVVYSYVRLLSSRRILGDDAVPVREAWAAASTLVDQDRVVMVEPGRSHADIASALMATPGLSSNDVPDVQLAALAVEHGLTLCSHDRGFARFDRLHWLDPLAS